MTVQVLGAFLTAIWLLCGGWWVRRGLDDRLGAGLGALLCFHLALIHFVPAVLVMLGYGVQDKYYTRLTILGFMYATVGLMCFLVGWLTGTRIGKATDWGKDQGILRRVKGLPGRQLFRYFVIAGLGAYLVVRAVGQVPTLTAVLGAGDAIVVAGITGALYVRQSENMRGDWGMWAMVGMLPVVTLLVEGFISYGIYASFAVLVFGIASLRYKRMLLVVGIVFTLIGPAILGAYLAQRGEIRSAVWEHREYKERVKRVGGVFGELTSGLERADIVASVDRLNKNALVGRTAERVGDEIEPEYGATLVQAVAFLVPRAVWPDKPIHAGSMDMAERYAGRRIVGSTSIGIGHVTEWYINWKVWGVAGGLFVVGVAFGMMDLIGRRALRYRRWGLFVTLFTIALPLVEVGKSFVGAVGGAGGALIAVCGLNVLVVCIVDIVGQGNAARRYDSVRGYEY